MKPWQTALALVVLTLGVFCFVLLCSYAQLADRQLELPPLQPPKANP